MNKANDNGHPHIERVYPSSALPGGEIRIMGKSLRAQELRRPRVLFGSQPGSVVISSEDFVIAKVPAGTLSDSVVVSTNGHTSNPHQLHVATTIAENLHPVTNPALDSDGNIFVTFSGPRGEKVPISIYKIDRNYTMKPFVTEMMNPTSIAFDRDGQMYVSSRHEGTVYRVASNGTMSPYAESMGIATGIAFDKDGNLYVGDRSGTIFKVARDRQIFVFAMLEASISAYHLAFDAHGNLFVTGPTISSFDCVYKIDVHGTVSTFYRGLGRPQGLAFDVDGNLYVAASHAGQRGIIKITPDAKASLEVAGSGLVGLAFAPGRSAILATTNAVHHLAWNIQGLPLVPNFS